jgi:DNA repair protein RadC
VQAKINYEVKTYTIKVADSDAAKITSPETAFEILKDSFNPIQEDIYLLIVDTKGQVIEKLLVARGSMTSAVIRPSDILRPVLLTNGNRIILAHNHPSKNLEPSEDDIKFTRKIIKACDLIGIDFLDHLIFSDENNYSFKQNNLI